MRLGLVTDVDHPGLPADDVPLIAAFAELGVDAVPVDWQQPPPSVNGLLIRSPWNYPLHAAAFERWLDVVSVPVWNPGPALRWNLRKTYLLDLLAAGLPVPPTLQLRRGSTPDLREAVSRFGKAVVKPEIGGTGIFTYAVDASNREDVEAKIAARLAEMDFLVQPFLPGVADGELSLVYIDGRYSHAVRKTAGKGEFRVHLEHGGAVEPTVPSAEDRTTADRFAAFVRDVPYARVDLVGGVLMELELIDPELFLRFHPPAVAALARGVTQRLRRV